MYELAPQANQLADRGRYGDSMMVHMNPAEVGIMNKLSGNQMTINPDTGQPEAFAFLLPLLGGLLGSGAIGAGLGGLGLSALAGGALGTGVGKFLETGSLKKSILSGALSFGIGSLAKGAMGAFADKAVDSGATGLLTTAQDLASPEAISLLSGGTGLTADVLPEIAGNTLSGAGYDAFVAKSPFLSRLVSNPSVAALGQTGAGLGSAVAPGLQSLAGSVGSEAVFPEYPEFDSLEQERYLAPQAPPPSRRARDMPSDFAANNRGEFTFFTDPEPQGAKGMPANQYQEGSLAALNRKYDPTPMKLGGRIEPVSSGNASDIGGMMGQFDRQEINDRGGKLPGIMGKLFGISNPAKFYGMTDEEMMLLEKEEKSKRMADGGLVDSIINDDSMMADESMRSEVELEDDANVFNDGVQAIMCDSSAPTEALTRFVDKFGMDRLHEVICEVISMAGEQDNEEEGVLTKEDRSGEGGMPIALRDGGSVDTIPASLEGKQSYLLAENEYILPEPVVRAVGGGDVEVGAMALNKFVDGVRARM